MLSLEPSADNSAQRIVTLQSIDRKRWARFAITCILVIFAAGCCEAQAASTPLSQQMGQSVMQNWPAGTTRQIRESRNGTTDWARS